MRNDLATSKPTLDDAESIESRIRPKQLRIAYDNLPNSFVTVPLAILIISILELSDPPLPAHFAAWIVSGLVLTAIRYYFFREFEKIKDSGFDYQLWAKRYSFSLVTAGVFWGVTPFLLFPENSFEHKVLITIMVMGLSTGVAFAYSSFLRPAIYYMTISMVPIISAIFIFGDNANYALAAMVGVYYAMLIKWLKENNKFGYEAIKTTIEKGDLAEKLRYSEVFHRAVIASSPDVVLLVDGDGKILMANQAAHKMLGYTESELKDKNISAVLPNDHEKVLVEGFVTTLGGWSKEEILTAVEVSAVRKSGTTLTVECSAAECVVNFERFFIITMRDVTERRRAQKELLSIMEAQPDILYVFNTRGELVKWNSALQNLCGLSPELMLKRPATEFVCAEDRGAVLEGIKEVFEKGTASVEVRFIRRDGTLTPMMCNGAVWKSPDGEVLGFIGVGKDMTDRIEAEKTARLMSLFPKFNPSPAIRCDASGVILMANDAAQTVFQTNILAGVKLQTFVREFDDLDIPDIIRNDSAVGFTSVFNDKHFNVAVRGVASMGVLHVYCADITELKRAEERLNKSRTSLSKAQEIALLGNWDWNINGGEMYWSSQTFRNLGYEPGSVVPSYQLLVESMSESDKELMKSSFQDAIFENVPLEFEARIEACGKEKYLYFKGEAAPNQDGETDNLIGTVQDITRAKTLEMEIHKAKAAAEEATRMKDKFVSLVAHDLRSPFTTILGFLQIIETDEKTPPAPQHKKMLERLIETAQNTLQMVDDLLNIARLQTGKMILHNHFAPASQLSDLAIAGVSSAAQKKGVKLENNIPADLLLYGDIPLLQEVFSNLASNAVKFCRKGDLIRFHSLYDPGAGVAVAVTDTGVGISQKLLPDLFRPEIKTSTPGTANETGTGFGLPLCADIIKAHDGRIEAASEPGQGSTFTIHLPKVRPSILVVEDDLQLRLLVTTMLAPLKCLIREAANGEEALDLVKTSPPHVIVSDVQMPVMNGYEFLAEMKKTADHKDIPVIIMTALGLEERSRAFQFGAADFISKPIDRADLLPRVRRFIGG